MAHTDREVVVEIVKKHYPKVNAEDTRLFQNIVDVCFFAGYEEKDIEDLCGSLSDCLKESFQDGFNTLL